MMGFIIQKAKSPLLFFLLAVLPFLLQSVPVQSALASRDEIWESKYLAAKITAHVNYDHGRLLSIITIRRPLRGNIVYNIDARFNQDGTFSGVVYLKDRFGGEGTYHVTGTSHDSWLEGSHHSGHKFRGEMISDDEVVLYLTHRNGQQYTIRAHRRN